MPSAKAILTAFGGIIINLTIGSTFTWGNLNPYVISYIRKNSVPSDLTYGSALWLTTLQGIGFGLVTFIGGIAEQKVGTRLTVGLGCLIFTLSTLTSAYTIKVSYYLFLLTYGFFLGVGSGLAYTPCLSLVMKWFPKHHGLAGGLVVAGYGGSGIIFDQVQTLYLNPYDIKPVDVNGTHRIDADTYFMNETILRKVPTMFTMLACICAGIQILGIILLFPIPSHQLEEPINSEEVSLLSNANDKEKASKETIYWNMKPSIAVKQRPFITIWLMYFLNGLIVSIVGNLYKNYGSSEVVNDDRFLAILGSVSAACNAIGRILWGILADKTSVTLALRSLCMSLTLFMATFYLTHVFAATAGHVLLTVWICGLFLSFSGFFSLSPTAITNTFGPDHSSTILGLLYTAEMLNGPVTATLTTFLFADIQYLGLFIICSFFAAIAFCLGISFNVRQMSGRSV